METVTVRLLPYAIADGPTNMAADETLLLSAIAGQASLRFYGWSSPTVSLGYFQPAAVRLEDPLLTTLPWVRRSTGGATLVHHHELTYALALPAELAKPPQAWMERMHEIVALALATICGASFQRARPSLHVENVPHSEKLCFRLHTPGDLLSGGHKVLGSAQRKQRHALLQHGGLLLARSEHTPTLPGIKELTGIDVPISALTDAIADAFREATTWPAIPATWTDDEQRLVEHLAQRKYASPAWNEKR